YKLLIRLIICGILFFSLYMIILPINTIEIFFMNIVGGVANSTSWPWFYDWTLQRLLLPFSPLLALNILLIVNTLRNKNKDTFELFLAITCIGFFLFSTMTAFKIGSGVGYFQDYIIASVLFISFWAWKFSKQDSYKQFLR